MDLAGRHVLITGGSSGIGLELGRQCAHVGAKVSLVARNPDKLRAARESIHSSAHRAPGVFVVSADVSNEQSVVVAVGEAQKAHGPIDVLITSAGIARPGYFEEIPAEAFERAMAVNYFGTLYPIRAVVPSMKQRRVGAIVLISSGAGLVGLFGYTAYSPSKFAVRGLAEALRGELAPTGIHVMIAYPPDTDTPQLKEESLTKPVETMAITAAAGVWSAESVAKAILNGLAKRRFVVAPGLRLTALAWLHSIMGPALFRSFDHTAAKARNKAGLASR